MGISGLVLLSARSEMLLAVSKHSLVFLSWFSYRYRSMRCLLRHDLRLLRSLRRVMNHRVSVFHPDTVSAGLRSKQFHERVVLFLFRPVALPFEQIFEGRETYRLGRHHPSRFGF